MLDDLERQKQAHLKWLKDEGGTEGPTHLETLTQPEQQARIKWLAKECEGADSILDIGGNRGYVLDTIGRLTGIRIGCGVDINPVNVELAGREYPYCRFEVGDVTKGLSFADRSFDVVIEADLLEHLPWPNGVESALKEAVRIASKKVLVTLPRKLDDKCALCFKHSWVPDKNKVLAIAWFVWNKSHCQAVNIGQDQHFYYLEASI